MPYKPLYGLFTLGGGFAFVIIGITYNWWTREAGATLWAFDLVLTLWWTVRSEP